MNTIEELIARLCPDGVEYKPLGEVCDIGTGSSNRNESSEKGEFPFFIRSRQVKRMDTFEFDEEAIIIPGEGGIGEIFHYVKGKYALHQRVYRIHFIEKSIDTRFAYYYLSSNFKRFILGKAVVATVTSIRKPMIAKFQLPIPSLLVQQEIVRMLDEMSGLVDALEEELAARKKQYEWSRDKLMRMNPGVECLPLAEVCNYSVSRVDASNINKHTYVCVDSLLQDCKGRVDADHVLPEGRLIAFEKGDVLIGNIRPYLKKICLADVNGGTNGDVLVIQRKDKKRTAAEYLYHALSSEDFFLYDMQYAKGGKMPRGDKTMIMKYLIPFPPLHVQQEIARKLDEMTALISALEEEIALRKQQYEYYRDKLLTFKRKETA